MNEDNSFKFSHPDDQFLSFDENKKKKKNWNIPPDKFNCISSIVNGPFQTIEIEREHMT